MLASRPGVVTTTPRPTSISIRGATCARPCRCGTRAWASAPSPTRTSATCCPWGPSTGSWPSCTCPSGWPSACGWGACCYAAGAGALYLCRVIGLSGPGRYVCAIGFMFTPYVLQYAGRISVILLPWAGLPWMVAFVILALRRGGWRLPGPLRLGGGPGQRHQRQLHPLRGHRPGAVAALRRGGGPGGHLAEGVGGGVEGRAALRAGLAVVGGRPPDGGGLRGQRPQVHRDGPGHQSAPRSPPRSSGAWGTGTSTGRTGSGRGPRRWWPTPRTSGSSSPASCVPALCFLAAAFSRWRHRAYFVLHHRGGHGAGRRAQPVRQSVRRGLADQVVPGRHHRRPGPALHRPGLAAGHPRAGHVPRRRGQRRCRPGATARADHRGVGHRGRRRRRRRPVVERGHHRQRLHPAGQPARLRAPGRLRPRRAPIPAPGSTPCPATTSPPSGGGTPSTPSTPGS